MAAAMVVTAVPSPASAQTAPPTASMFCGGGKVQVSAPVVTALSNQVGRVSSVTWVTQLLYFNPSTSQWVLWRQSEAFSASVIVSGVGALGPIIGTAGRNGWSNNVGYGYTSYVFDAPPSFWYVVRNWTHTEGRWAVALATDARSGRQMCST